MTPHPVDNPVPRRIIDRGTRRVIHLTEHARHRAAAMGASPLDIARLAWRPHVCYRGSNGPGRVQKRHDTDIAIVFIVDQQLVVTVLWDTVDDYVRDD